MLCKAVNFNLSPQARTGCAQNGHWDVSPTQTLCTAHRTYCAHQMAVFDYSITECCIVCPSVRHEGQLFNISCTSGYSVILRTYQKVNRRCQKPETKWI